MFTTGEKVVLTSSFHGVPKGTQMVVVRYIENYLGIAGDAAVIVKREDGGLLPSYSGDRAETAISPRFLSGDND